MPRKSVIASKPELYRAGIARGLMAKTNKDPVIDPKGGDNRAGIIRGMAIITRGEALGHGMWIDTEMLSSVVDAINATTPGAKARFTHPDISGDGLGKFTGRVKNAELQGDVVRGDLHFAETAHATPDGDLARYLMQLASDDPAAFGNSIAFAPDFDAAEAFMLANGARWQEDGWGDKILVGFKSPDPENVRNLPHARMNELRAVDAVDEPAANPSGLFHRGQELAQEAEALLSWTLGLSSQRPALRTLAVDADRVGGFITRFLDRNGLAITTKDQTMPNGKLNAENEPKPAAQPTTESSPAAPKEPAAPEGAKTEPATEPATEAPAATPAQEEPPASEMSAGGDGPKFLAAFGDRGGVWFAQGKTFAEAQELHVGELKSQIAQLSTENADLKKQIQLLKGEPKPVSFQAADDPKKSEPKSDLKSGLNSSQAKFAQAIRIPGQN